MERERGIKIIKIYKATTYFIVVSVAYFFLRSFFDGGVNYWLMFIWIVVIFAFITFYFDYRSLSIIEKNKKIKEVPLIYLTSPHIVSMAYSKFLSQNEKKGMKKLRKIFQIVLFASLIILGASIIFI